MQQTSSIRLNSLNEVQLKPVVYKMQLQMQLA